MEEQKKNKICIVGIAGGTASGKTTIVKKLKEHFGEELAILSHDSYYKAHDEMAYEERCNLNYDHPNSFDTDLMIEDVKKLKQGLPVEIPVYDYTIHNRVKETTPLEPKSIIILDGILILESKELRDLMDIKIFVDTDADIRLMRRIKRDMRDRARSVESVITQYSETVKPMHEQFVEPSKKYADIIIPRGGKNKVGISILKEHLRNQMQEMKS